MAFDGRSSKIVLFGGGAPNADPGRNDTWTWDGSTWHQEHPATSPPTTGYGWWLKCYDAGSQVPTFAGSSAWKWDGSNWNQYPATTPPPPRNLAGCAFGAQSGFLLYGGVQGMLDNLNDTWVWDGSRWSQLHPPTTPGGGPTFMAHEDSRHDVLMLEQDGTWTWSGSNWNHLHPTATPGFEYFRSITYDAAHDRVILFGGKTGAGQPTNDTWLWDGLNWSRVTG
jgi:hypothetical protein